MNFYRLTNAIIITGLLFVLACKHEVSNSFYYWKSVYHLTKLEEKCLREQNVSKLYIRFFDVDWDESIGKVVPIARIHFAEKISPQFEIIPVVFIVNKTLQNTNFQDIPDLANKILDQVNYIASCNNINFRELQLDCDWTEKTHRNYFSLLDIIRKTLNNEAKILSATIRLHQVKYKNITGIPPVNRGMLMYYNMGKITSETSSNSIFNTNDAARYISYIPDYPLTLDVALPAFSWGVHIRKGKVIELLNSMSLTDFESNIKFSRLDSSSFSALESFFSKGFYFMKNDLIKVEEITPAECNVAAQQLIGKLPKSKRAVAIFHLDSLIISHYEKKDFEKVFNTYH